MKKVNWKYIRLTESELKRIINEEIEKVLEYKNPRRDLVNIAKNNVKELIKHWCVVKFYKTAQLSTTNINHWIGEVANFMNNICDVHLKGKMDNFDTRKTAIIEGFNKEGVLDNPTLCERFLVQKLMEERIDCSKYRELIGAIAQNCFDELPSIIDIMARSDVYEINKYVNTL